MVHKFNREEPIWNKATYVSQDPVSEYLMVSNPTKLEVAASSVYGTLPRFPKCRQRGMSEASIPAKYLTVSRCKSSEVSNAKPIKKSFFAGLAQKIKSGKAQPNHRRLQWSPSEGCSGSTGSLLNENSPIPQRKTQERPQRLWTRGLESVYASQRKLTSWRTSTKLKKIPSKETSYEFGSCSSSDSTTPTSSAPSSPDTQRSFLSYNAKRQRRKIDSDDMVASSPSRAALQEIPHKDNFNHYEEPKKSSGCRILVLGAEGVGKSALTVRFLTKRFIGEYAPEIESVYDQTMNIEGKDINVNIWDSALPELYQNSNGDETHSDSSTHSLSSSLMSVTSSGTSSCHRLSNSSLEDDTTTSNNNNNKPSVESNQENFAPRKNKLRESFHKRLRRWRSNEENEGTDGEMTSSNDVTESNNVTEIDRRLKWADGIVVMYSICDRSSLDVARDIVRYVRRTEAAEMCRISSNDSASVYRKPILVIGNKLDLGHLRRVQSTKARELASSYSCNFIELSVSEKSEPVSEAMREHVKNVRKISKSFLKNKGRKQRW